MLKRATGPFHSETSEAIEIPFHPFQFETGICLKLVRLYPRNWNGTLSLHAYDYDAQGFAYAASTIVLMFHRRSNYEPLLPEFQFPFGGHWRWRFSAICGSPEILHGKSKHSSSFTRNQCMQQRWELLGRDTSSNFATRPNFSVCRKLGNAVCVLIAHLFNWTRATTRPRVNCNFCPLIVTSPVRRWREPWLHERIKGVQKFT